MIGRSTGSCQACAKNRLETRITTIPQQYLPSMWWGSTRRRSWKTFSDCKVEKKCLHYFLTITVQSVNFATVREICQLRNPFYWWINILCQISLSHSLLFSDVPWDEMMRWWQQCNVKSPPLPASRNFSAGKYILQIIVPFPTGGGGGGSSKERNIYYYTSILVMRTFYWNTVTTVYNRATVNTHKWGKTGNTGNKNP